MGTSGYLTNEASSYETSGLVNSGCNHVDSEDEDASWLRIEQNSFKNQTLEFASIFERFPLYECGRALGSVEVLIQCFLTLINSDLFIILDLPLTCSSAAFLTHQSNELL